jgi:hypothetical protein
MRNYSLVPRPWWEVGLTILPGLIFLLGPVFSTWPPLRFLMLAALILLIISSVLVAAKRRSLFQAPVWGLIPLGGLAGFGSLWTFSSLGFYPTCFLLVAIGLLFARHNGLSASFFVLTGGVLTANYAVEPGMYFANSPFRRIFLDAGMFALLWILSPLWVLRSRSILGQAMGLLLPMAAYSVAFVFALSSVSGFAHPWFQLSISQSISIAEPFIALFAIIAMAAAVYAWISRWGFTAGAAHVIETDPRVIDG